MKEDVDVVGENRRWVLEVVARREVEEGVVRTLLGELSRDRGCNADATPSTARAGKAEGAGEMAVGRASTVVVLQPHKGGRVPAG